MAKAWIIIKEDERLGPFEAAQIREMLRDGTVDPFDLVCQEGSQIKRELVEVDEIFFEHNNLKFGSDTQERSAQNGFGTQGSHLSDQFGSSAVVGSGADEEKTIGTHPKNGTQAADPFESAKPAAGSFEDRHVPTVPADIKTPGMKLALADEQSVKTDAGQSPNNRSSSSKPRPRKDPKKFQLNDGSGRVLGPLSAGEIQDMYFKGVLGASVQVMKTGSESKVPIKKFVAVYRQSKGKRPGQQGAHPQLRRPPPQAAPQISMGGPGPRWMTWVAALLMTIALGGLGWSGYHLYDSGKISKWFSQSNKKSQKRRSYKKKKSVKASGSLPRPSSFKKKRTKKTYNRKRSRSKRNSIYRKRVKPKYVQKTRKPLTKAKLVRPRAFRKANIARRTSYKPPVKNQRRRTSRGPQVATLRAGMNVSGLGPMAFNLGAVKSCKTKCSIQMVGAGGRVTVKFFKIHYAEKLMSRRGRVSISGLVQKAGGQTTILLNGIK